MRALAILVVAGCWRGEPAPAVAPARPVLPQLAGFAEADAIVVDGTDYTLTTVSLAHDVPRTLATTRFGARLPDPPTEISESATAPPQILFIGGWADRARFYARTGPREVIAISAAGIVDVGLPPRARGERDPHLFAPWSEVDLVVDEDGAWWSRCVEEGPEDGGRCATWSSTMLWPHTDHADTEKLPGEFAWPALEDPPGYRLDGNRCIAADGTVTSLYVPRSPDDTKGIIATHWVSRSPPRLLVILAELSEFHVTPPDDFELHDGCGAVLVSGYAATAGPGDLWAADSTIYRGAKALGTIPGGTVHFRPR